MFFSARSNSKKRPVINVPQAGRAGSIGPVAQSISLPSTSNSPVQAKKPEVVQPRPVQLKKAASFVESKFSQDTTGFPKQRRSSIVHRVVSPSPKCHGCVAASAAMKGAPAAIGRFILEVPARTVAWVEESISWIKSIPDAASACLHSVPTRAAICIQSTQALPAKVGAWAQEIPAATVSCASQFPARVVTCVLPRKTALSPELVEKLNVLFAKLDLNMDGTITKAEAVKFWGRNFAQVNAQAMFNEVDDDGNEEISHEEWLDFWRNVLAQGSYKEEEVIEEIETIMHGGSWVDWDDGRMT